MKHSVLSIIFSLLSIFVSYAQETIIKGRVTDASTGVAIPFATIVFKGNLNGVNTDFDGFYTLKSTQPFDSVRASYLGYKPKSKKIKNGVTQLVDFQLIGDLVSLKEISIVAGENPAHPIIRKAIANKDKLNKQNAKSYELESYVKVLVDIDNISENIKKRKLFNPITSMFDSLQYLAGEDGSAHLPVFFSENLSDVYYKSNPEQKKEIVKATRLSGIGIQDGMLTSQISGSTFQEYNFNDNKINFFNKDFLSPISDAGFLFYEYYLIDTTVIDTFTCFKIKVKPRNKYDLLFSGFIWITDSTFALKQINLDIGKTANLNFVEKAQFQQELVPVGNGIWFPVKSRIVIDFADISKNFVGLVAKFYVSSKNIVLDKYHEDKFYENQIELAEDIKEKEPEFWDINRHEQLTETDIKVYNMIDTIKNIPRIKGAVTIAYTVLEGYANLGKIDLGPIPALYASNTVQGTKIRLGARTNEKFSKKLIFSGYGAFGFRDAKFRYNAQAEYILSRKNWTKVGFQRRDDIDQIGVDFEFDFSSPFAVFASSLFTSTAQISRFALLNRKKENRIWIESEIKKGFTERLSLHTVDFTNFFSNNLSDTLNRYVQTDFKTTEIKFESRFAFNEYYIQNDNQRINLGTVKAPVLTFRYTIGINNFLGSKLSYQKASFTVSQRLKLGLIGRSVIQLNAGKTFSTVPFALLDIHRGNETPFYTGAAFNLMNNFEFISDEFVSLDVQHFFGGLFLNRFPLLNRLKWREVVSARTVIGRLSNRNSAININNDFRTLEQKPYTEISAGVENILKVIRVDFLYRLSYIDEIYKRDYQIRNQGNTIRKFGVKFSLGFSF